MDKTKGVTKAEMVVFKKYVESEEYDTDSVFYDVSDEKGSNILLRIKSNIFGGTFTGYIKFKKGIYFVIFIHILFNYYIYIQSEVVRLAVVIRFFIGLIIKIVMIYLVHTKGQNYLSTKVNMIT